MDGLARNWLLVDGLESDEPLLERINGLYWSYGEWGNATAASTSIAVKVNGSLLKKVLIRGKHLYWCWFWDLMVLVLSACQEEGILFWLRLFGKQLSDRKMQKWHPSYFMTRGKAMVMISRNSIFMLTLVVLSVTSASCSQEIGVFSGKFVGSTQCLKEIVPFRIEMFHVLATKEAFFLRLLSSDAGLMHDDFFSVSFVDLLEPELNKPYDLSNPLDKKGKVVVRFLPNHSCAGDGGSFYLKGTIVFSEFSRFSGKRIVGSLEDAKIVSSRSGLVEIDHLYGQFSVTLREEKPYRIGVSS